MSLVSVYISSHNYGRFLHDAIESVMRQTYKNWELLIFNDGSSDNTAEVMNLYKGDPRVRLFETPKIGLTKVCNTALREAKGKFLIRLDGDDAFDENILLILTHYMEADPELALVFPDYYLMDEFGEIFAQERRQKLSESNHLLDVPPNGACTMVKISVLQALGGYREDLGAQDGFDLWTRISKNYRCRNVNLPLFYYRRHGTNLTNNSMRILSARRQIKKDTIIEQLDAYKPTIAVIPCRKNYDFAADLWDQRIGSETLLIHAIRTCLGSKAIDHVVVACDNPRVKETLSLFNDARLTYFERKMEDTIHSKSLVPTLHSIAQIFDPQMNGSTVVCYVQAPFVTSETLEESLYTMLINQTDSSIGVQEVKHHLLQRTSFGLQSLNPKSAIRSDFNVVYAEANIAMATRNKNLARGSMTGPSVSNFIASPDECFFIDSVRNLKVANIILEDKNAIHPMSLGEKRFQATSGQGATSV